MEHRAGRRDRPGQRREVLHRPDFGVGQRERDQRRAIVKRVDHRRRRDQPIAIGRDPDDLVSAALQVGERLQNRRVLDGRSDDSAAIRDPPERTENRQIVGFRAAAGEYDLTGCSADQLGDRGARLRHRAAGALAGLMDRGGIAVPVAHEGFERRAHMPPKRRAGVMIQVDSHR